MLKVIAGIAFGLLIGSIVAVFATRAARRRGIEAGRDQAIEEYRRDQESAVHLLLSRLNNLITRNCDEEAVAGRAESIIALVRSYQDAVACLSEPIAPQLIRMQHALDKADVNAPASPARDEIRDALVDLRVVWPEKKIEMELLVRKLFGQLTTLDRHSQLNDPAGPANP